MTGSLSLAELLAVSPAPGQANARRSAKVGLCAAQHAVLAAGPSEPSVISDKTQPMMPLQLSHRLIGSHNFAYRSISSMSEPAVGSSRTKSDHDMQVSRRYDAPSERQM